MSPSGWRNLRIFGFAAVIPWEVGLAANEPCGHARRINHGIRSLVDGVAHLRAAHGDTFPDAYRALITEGVSCLSEETDTSGRLYEAVRSASRVFDVGCVASNHPRFHEHLRAAYEPRARTIHVSRFARGVMRVNAVLHELAHAVGGHDGRNKQRDEIVAEGVAFVVASCFDVDTSPYSVPYVTRWSGWGYPDHAFPLAVPGIRDLASVIANVVEERFEHESLW